MPLLFNYNSANDSLKPRLKRRRIWRTASYPTLLKFYCYRSAKQNKKKTSNTSQTWEKVDLQLEGVCCQTVST
ncbi:hypothetical protein DPMN_176393 [Dreissena polymorpha]|uniref:Uncharacterized protein n=1 Tax=Dreissena polymorpha TaxID=45954 RepID=A0A9D4E8B0_DREPO|nr:hypothetical protein DPMN_176393 [Dreissena polymorpha]